MAVVFGCLYSRRCFGALCPSLCQIANLEGGKYVQRLEAGLVSSNPFSTASTSPVPPATTAPSIHPDEVEKFRKMANEWWNSKGDFQPLHQMNPTRCRFVRDFTCLHFGLDKMKPNALEGLEILDVGCGGGILSESVARMGAKVTGIDAVEESIEVAKAHAQHDPELASRLQYDKVSAESLAQKDKKFDVVLASEVIEHVKDPRAFVGVLESLMQPNGAVIVSTINRTPQAYLGTIVVAEYMMRLLAVGTHDFRKFITPDELAMAAQDAGLEMKHLAGMSYTPFLDRWDLKEDTSINYIAGFIKQTRAKN